MLASILIGAGDLHTMGAQREVKRLPWRLRSETPNSPPARQHPPRRAAGTPQFSRAKEGGTHDVPAAVHRERRTRDVVRRDRSYRACRAVLNERRPRLISFASPHVRPHGAHVLPSTAK